MRPHISAARRVLPLLLLSLAASGCRDGVAPYDAPDRGSSGEDVYRLTWGIGMDRNPQWSRSGDSVYFHTTYWRELGGHGEGIMLRIAREGGAAVPLAPGAQPNPLSRLLDPVLSPDGSQLAYLQLLRTTDPATCRDAFTEANREWMCGVLEPRLDSAIVRVRAAAATQAATADPGIGVKYLGIDGRRVLAAGPPYYESAYPFQQAWGERNDASSLRPSWSHDGRRLVFSDGLRLLLWDVGAPAPVPLAASADGVAPAWSPDGQWIAFTINARVDSVQYQCDCAEGTARARHWRWGYTLHQQIAVIRPDGTGLRVLTDGHEAAWAPAGDVIYYTHSTGIRSIPLAGGAHTLVPGTVDGEAPSVSPDGAWLAFSRRKSFFEDHDLWIARLRN